MGTPAAVQGDRIMATCAAHQIPNPASGAPQPGPPMPFSAPLNLGLGMTVLIDVKPAAVAGSNGVCTPPHVGLHPADPFMAPPAQMGTVTMGSPTVLIGGKPAARTGSTGTVCFGAPGQVTGTAATVQIA